jgi:hypothetical protein
MLHRLAKVKRKSSLFPSKTFKAHLIGGPSSYWDQMVLLRPAVTEALQLQLDLIQRTVCRERGEKGFLPGASIDG